MAREYLIDFDAADDDEFVGAPLREEASRIRQRERSEHEGIIERDRNRAWGRAVSDASEFAFASIPHRWPAPIKTWAAPQFAEHAGRLANIRDAALAEASNLGELAGLAEGLHRQADHADHMRQLVNGETDRPWLPHHRAHDGGTWQLYGTNIFESALLNAYGPDPRPAFVDAMARTGIVPSVPQTITAGNTLRRFHVVGDPYETKHGWAILHRCPGAGTYGSLLTRAVHHWHVQPDRMKDTGPQFLNDVERAMTEIGAELNTDFRCLSIVESIASFGL